MSGSRSQDAQFATCSVNAPQQQRIRTAGPRMYATTPPPSTLTRPDHYVAHDTDQSGQIIFHDDSNLVNPTKRRINELHAQLTDDAEAKHLFPKLSPEERATAISTLALLGDRLIEPYHVVRMPATSD